MSARRTTPPCAAILPGLVAPRLGRDSPGSVELRRRSPRSLRSRRRPGRAADVGQRARRRARRPAPRDGSRRGGRRGGPRRPKPPILDDGALPGAARPPLVLRARRVQALRLPLLRRAGPGRSRRGLVTVAPTPSRRPRPTNAGPTRSSPTPSAETVDAAPGPVRREGAGQRGPRCARVERAVRLGGTPGDDRVLALLAREGVASDETLARAHGPDRRLARQRPSPRPRRRAAACRGAVRPARRGHGPARQHRPARRTGDGARSVVDYKTDRVGTDGAGVAGRAIRGAARGLRARGRGRRGTDCPRGARLPRATRRAGGRGLRPGRPRGCARQRLEGLVAQIRAGTFEPAASPTPRSASAARRRRGSAPARRGARPRRARGGAMSRLATFGYGSLVSRASDRRDARARCAAADPRPPRRLAAAVVARPRQRPRREGVRADRGRPVRLLPRPQHRAGARSAGEDEWPNGALIELTDAELDRLDLRELRYDRVEVTGDVRAGEPELRRGRSRTRRSRRTSRRIPRRAPSCSRPICAPARPRSRSWARTSWSRSGARRSRCPAPVVEARLVRDEIPEGNPRAW